VLTSERRELLQHLASIQSGSRRPQGHGLGQGINKRKEGKECKRELRPTVCPFCGCGYGLFVGVENGVARNIENMPGHPANDGALCLKGNAAIQRWRKLQ